MPTISSSAAAAVVAIIWEAAAVAAASNLAQLLSERPLTQSRLDQAELAVSHRGTMERMVVIQYSALSQRLLAVVAAAASLPQARETMVRQVEAAAAVQHLRRQRRPAGLVRLARAMREVATVA